MKPDCIFVVVLQPEKVGEIMTSMLGRKNSKAWNGWGPGEAIIVQGDQINPKDVLIVDEGVRVATNGSILWFRIAPFLEGYLCRGEANFNDLTTEPSAV
jgi:hypothetical protein